MAASPGRAAPVTRRPGCGAERPAASRPRPAEERVSGLGAAHTGGAGGRRPALAAPASPSVGRVSGAACASATPGKSPPLACRESTELRVAVVYRAMLNG